MITTPILAIIVPIMSYMSGITPSKKISPSYCHYNKYPSIGGIGPAKMSPLKCGNNTIKE